MRRILVASFRSEADLRNALHKLREAHIEHWETYTPCPIEDASAPSPLPLIILLAGLIGAAVGYAMQVYADTISYPLNIGGRPNISWPSFVPIAFEIGVLAAVAAGFLGFFVINRMPRPYDAIDEALTLREASRAAWIVVIRPSDALLAARARDLIEAARPSALEELGA